MDSIESVQKISHSCTGWQRVSAAAQATKLETHTENSPSKLGFKTCASGCWASAAAQAHKLFEGAEREVRQLRLACIHPQMTAYWQNLSAEMQLDTVHSAMHASTECL